MSFDDYMRDDKRLWRAYNRRRREQDTPECPHCGARAGWTVWDAGLCADEWSEYPLWRGCIPTLYLRGSEELRRKHDMVPYTHYLHVCRACGEAIT